MLTIKEVIKTLYNALLQRLKKHRGNWEQNDPTADDYIKNRPFYTDETNKEIVVKTTNFTATSSYWWGSPFAFIPIVGETYKVTFDDKEYICTCYESDGKCIGNIYVASAGNVGTDTGEPFFYYWYDSYEYGMCVRNRGKHTITIEKIKIVKIDKKYLPDDINIDLAPVAKSGDYWDLENIPETYSDVVRYGASQSLSAVQKNIATTNIGAVGYETQTLTEAQKLRARTNINAASSDDTITFSNAMPREITWDGNTNGLYSFRYNAISYYRVSGEYTPFESISSLITTYQSGGYSYTSYARSGINCYALGGAIVVTKAGSCSLAVTEGGTNLGFNAPIDGIYLFKYDTSIYCSKIVYGAIGDVATLLPTYQTGTKIYAKLNEDGTFFDELIPDTIARVNNLPIHETYAQGLGKTYTWNGVTDGLSSDYTEIYPGSTYYKISDYIPTKEEMIGASFLIQTTAQVDEYVISSVDSNSTTSYTIYNMHILVDKEGIWFRKYSLNKEYNYVKSLTLNGKVIELSAPLDEKFIPSTIARTEYVDNKVSDLVNAAPEALDTLKELSTALGDDPNFATTVLTQLSNKADKDDIVQPDWNQNDETAPDYIKNRTHYLYNDYSELSIVFTRNVTKETIGFRFIVYENTVYVVYCDDVKYVVTTIKDEIDGLEGLYLGDPMLQKYPFYISYGHGSPGGYVYVVDDGQAHSVTLWTSTTVSKASPIDAKYIPDSIARVSQVPEIDETLSKTQAAADAKIVGENIKSLNYSIVSAKNEFALTDKGNGYTYIVSMHDGNLISEIGVEYIQVTTMPNKMDYMHGEDIDTDGLVITAVCYDGTQKDVTSQVKFDWVNKDYGVKAIYEQAGIDISTYIPVNVTPFDAEAILLDFVYTDNGDGTYTITDWKKTYNGVSSEKLIVPNYRCIIL